MVDTTLENMLKHTIRLNGILIPANSAESILSRYTHPLVIWNHVEDYPCGLMGSCLCIYYRDRYLLLCSRHQLKLLQGRSYEDMGLLDKDGYSFCSAAGIKHYNDDFNAVDLHDLTVFDFTEPCNARGHMKERFFNLKEAPPVMRSDHVVGFVVSGYPSKKQDYDFTDGKKQLGLALAPVVCTLAPLEDQPEDPTILKLNTLDPLKFDSDGMSGGGAFVIHLDNGVGYTHLAGMIVRGGSNNFYILRMGYIMSVIDEWLAV